MPRARFLTALLIPTALIAAILLLMFALGFWPARTGRVEKLNNPIPLRGWTAASLLADDGRIIPIPGIDHLPATSPALTQFTQRGIEITPDGRLICLAKIWHWCGNDPVRSDLLRVDLSDALLYLQIGDPTNPVPNPDYLAPEKGGIFKENAGWDISDYIDFDFWQGTKTELLPPRNTPAPASTPASAPNPH